MAWFHSHTAQTASVNLKQSTRQNVLNWVYRAWASISNEVVRESLVFCGITADFAGGGNDKMFSHIPRVLVREVSNEDNDTHDEADDDEPPDIMSGDDFDPFESDTD